MRDLPHQKHFFSGGPWLDLPEQLRRRWQPSHTTYRALAFVIFTWVVPLLLATLSGPPFVRMFLRDVPTHARLLLAGPIAILIEPLVDDVLRRAANNFLVCGILPADRVEQFEASLRRAERLRHSALAGLVVLGGAYLFHGMASQWSDEPMWRLLRRWGMHSPAWIWYAWVSRPLMHFVLLRWLWRTAIWSGFLQRTSRLPLRLSASHPDRTGGLGFLTQAHMSFAFVAFPFAVVWCAAWGERFKGGETTSDSLLPVLVGITVFLALVFIGPLLLFTPQLLRLRISGMLSYGRLASAYCQAFDRRWIGLEAPRDDLLLGTPDLQSLADLQSAVGAARATRFVAIDKGLVIALAVAIALPALPLLGLIWPMKELIRHAILPLL